MSSYDGITNPHFTGECMLAVAVYLLSCEDRRGAVLQRHHLHPTAEI